MCFPGRFGLKSQFSAAGPPNNDALPKVKPNQESPFSGKLAAAWRRNLPNTKINIISFAAFHLVLMDENKIHIILELNCFIHIVPKIFQKGYVLKHINKMEHELFPV